MVYFGLRNVYLRHDRLRHQGNQRGEFFGTFTLFDYLVPTNMVLQFLLDLLYILVEASDTRISCDYNRYVHLAYRQGVDDDSI